MSDRRVRRVAISLLTGVAAVTGCGNGTDEVRPRPAVSPASPSSAASPEAAQSAPAASPQATGKTGIAAARLSLRAFLRGHATGDPEVCRHVAAGSEFERQEPFKGDCRTAMRDMPHLLRPQERQALRTVEVSGGRIDDRGEATIPFSGLKWTSGSMTAATLQPTFVLRRVDGLWKIVR